MTTEPKRREWELSGDFYGRQTVLVCEVDGGQRKWSIISRPVSQRDDGEKIYSLTLRQLRDIAKIVESER